MKLTNPELIVKRSYKEVYKDGDKIVKIFEKDHPKSAVFNEALNTVRVEEAGLDIPKLDEVTQIDEKWALVIECQAGETLETVMEKDPDNLEKYMAEFVDLQLQIHARRLRCYETERQTGKQINQLKELDATQRY
mgnify:CR=1 FL=1